MANLRITLIQTSLHWENIPANLAMLDKKLKGLENTTDLVILPEMFSTGFSMRPEKLAEAPGGLTTQWMAEKARGLNAVITGSIIVRDQGRYFNRLIWMRPDGACETYDKKHLFGLGEETSYYTAGSKKLITGIKGWKVCPMICYDLRFPAWCRNTENYDLYINIANWPEKRAEHWKTLSRARAIENLCYVAALNRVGDDGNGFSHSGDSQVIDPAGNVLYQKAWEEDVSTIFLEREVVTKARRMFPFLRDMDPFELK
ncbi:putative amidohydrolase [Anseongella ginsenosidimutans]|uniref:Omega-amidase YafV n=1 Tax=Anseongella ginsenosidimutans TaxID=496056 RepID=A0A4R3KPJ4_9SPHI|nr:amidohydrolase [Anseongella ginsenosidimutans]QEC53660.1 amidohydrolase [Anseongella ginsenosidimutans]TCS86090.1 putative amidohydrolase [Anseongella ginsenosidimutans]